MCLAKSQAGVAHVLPRRRDAAERRVVVGAEVRASDRPSAGGNERAERRRSVRSQD